MTATWQAKKGAEEIHCGNCDTTQDADGSTKRHSTCNRCNNAWKRQSWAAGHRRPSDLTRARRRRLGWIREALAQ